MGTPSELCMAVHECFPSLRVTDGSAAIAWYVAVFDATERFRLVDPADGRVGHAEVALGEGMVLMLSDAYPEMGLHAPPAEAGRSGFALHLHVDDADALIAKAVEAGATLLRAPSDQFYGERSGTIVDPYGHMWTIGHDIEDVTPEEMQRRWDTMGEG